MKKQKITGKLTLKKYDFAELGNEAMNKVRGGAEAEEAAHCSKTNGCKPTTITAIDCVVDPIDPVRG